MVSPLISIPELSIEIYATALPDSDRGSRRRAETEAVASLAAAIFGHGAEIRHTPAGAPVLLLPGSLSASPAISISHSTTAAVIAVSRSLTAVGVDIELPRANLQRVASRFLRPGETAVHGDSLPALLRAWTAKEAAFKAAGIAGITLADISIDPTCASASVPGRNAPTLTLRHFPGPDGSLIAVAAGRL